MNQWKVVIQAKTRHSMSVFPCISFQTAKDTFTYAVNQYSNNYEIALYVNNEVTFVADGVGTMQYLQTVDAIHPVYGFGKICS